MPNNFPVNFSFRLAADDAARLRAVAEAHGFPASEWARKVLSEAAGVEFERRAVRLRVLHADHLAGYLRELAAQGNNLNQIAHELHKGEPLTSQSLEYRLEEIRRQNEKVMVAVLDALGVGDEP